jgi:multidrug efflux system outer membrane protein
MNLNGVVLRSVRVLAACAAIVCASAFTLFADDQATVVTPTQAVDQALAGGPDIRLSNASLGTAQAQYDAAAAANSFGLSGTGNLGHTEAGTVRSNGQIANNPYDSAEAGISMSAPLSTSLGASLSQALFENSPQPQGSQLHLSASTTLWDGYPGGSGRASVQQAALAFQGTQALQDSNRKTIVYQVKQAYYTMIAQQRQLAIFQQTLAQRQEEMKKTQALYDAQSASRIDLEQAQINQTQADLDLKKAQDSLEIDRENLSALVGWPLERAYSVAEVPDMAVPSMDVGEAVKTALAQRADLKQSAISIASGDISVSLARAKGAPVVKANGSFDYNVSWSSPVSTSTGWGAGVSVSLPVMDAGATAAAVKQAQLQNETLKIQQEKLIASISTSVKNAIYSLRDLLARADLAQASLDLAQNQYDLAQLQFDTGVMSNLDVLTASVALTTAQVNLAKARSDAQLGVLALQSAMGN